ncbi:LysM peptidoglycan-binding domain-containing protein [Sinorhizobium sp. BG8]|uniref:LysM peptidoglycan-binding domain-containing protein n=1 Tax=Sinorhizobium sp. BG8 TaxID=2613773 RepID=UPI00193D3A70|nr:LysM peptidoglycan-binding domain-containing protein [Sinorhizobium sp. BG8]QRM54852.1 LysM peptidoglycan-binding domain-containing protein [Sinorhizobium sp. BG8]
MMKYRTALVALLVLVAATLLMVFLVLPNMNREKEAQAPQATEGGSASTATSETKTADGKQARPSTEGESEGQAAGAAGQTAESPAAGGEASSDSAAAGVTPGFDVLRVEPDGSTVIAGHAQPNSTLKILNGETVVATADVGPTGDFAAVFDKPLVAGDYQLTLNSTGQDGVTKKSEEVATISVPKDAGGKLLAMVSKPGEASRLITVTPTAEGADDSAAPSGVAAGTQPAAADGQEQAAVQTDTGTGTAVVADSAAAPTTDVHVSAVELEGDKIFVAGNARPGALVRIYANNTLVGQMKADDAGRYVVDGNMKLPVGRHTIRADVMSADGSKVELRASVPFDRPEGEQVAVVAQTGTTDVAGTSLGPVGSGTFDKLRNEADQAVGLLSGLYAEGRLPTAEQLAAARSATEIALKSLAEFKPAADEGTMANGMAAKAAAAAADALTKLKALPQDVGAVGAEVAAIETAVRTALAPTMQASDVPQTETASAATTPAGAGTGTSTTLATETQTAASQNAGTGSDAGATTAKPAAETATSGGAAAAETAAVTTDEPKTVEQAPLTESKTSVIIRRGDTLWQISRRVYGKGVRYTTIYMANQDQIHNPDRILPGQVFGVPDKALDDAEELHRKRMQKK